MRRASHRASASRIQGDIWPPSAGIPGIEMRLSLVWDRGNAELNDPIQANALMDR